MSYDGWLYNGKEFEETLIQNYYGFVYEIEHLETGKKYIGKKFFWSSKILNKTKTRKRRKRVLVESDWKEYYGSSELLKKDIQEMGADKFRRTILYLCKSKGECAYMELYEQMVRQVLLKPNEYYNSYVGTRIHRNHVKGLLFDQDEI